MCTPAFGDGLGDGEEEQAVGTDVAVPVADAAGSWSYVDAQYRRKGLERYVSGPLGRLASMRLATEGLREAHVNTSARAPQYRTCCPGVTRHSQGEYVQCACV